MNPKYRIKKEVGEIISSSTPWTVADKVSDLIEAELHEYGKHLQGVIIELKWDMNTLVEKYDMQIEVLETKHEELQQNIVELQKDVEARDRTIERLENDLSEAVEIMKAIYANVDQYHLDFAFSGGECYDKLKDYLGH